MSLADDISANSRFTYGTKWQVRIGTGVPAAAALKLSNDAIFFENATVLYADLDGSAGLVRTKKWEFAGQVYKTFLYTVSRLIRKHSGSIACYDGTRVMGVFISGLQQPEAVSCALEINYAVKNLVQPELNKYWQTDYRIRHIVGIDSSSVRAARTGVRGDNDVVWIGNAPNLAAKLTALNADIPTWITKRVYDKLQDAQKLEQGECIWEKWSWGQHNNEEIWSTTQSKKFT